MNCHTKKADVNVEKMNVQTDGKIYILLDRPMDCNHNITKVKAPKQFAHEIWCKKIQKWKWNFIATTLKKLYLHNTFVDSVSILIACDGKIYILAFLC